MFLILVQIILSTDIYNFKISVARSISQYIQYFSISRFYIFLSTDIYNFKISVASRVQNEDQTSDDVDHNKLYQFPCLMNGSFFFQLHSDKFTFVQMSISFICSCKHGGQNSRADANLVLRRRKSTSKRSS